jgi:hypothetical protein
MRVRTDGRGEKVWESSHETPSTSVATSSLLHTSIARSELANECARGTREGGLRVWPSTGVLVHSERGEEMTCPRAHDRTVSRKRRSGLHHFSQINTNIKTSLSSRARACTTHPLLRVVHHHSSILHLLCLHQAMSYDRARWRAVAKKGFAP